MKKKKNKSGFTLVELLATIVVIALIFGIGYTTVSRVIDNSKEKSLALTESNILKTVNLFSHEYSSDVTWYKENDNQVSCIAINELVNKGYLKEEQIDKIEYDYVVLTKNNSGTIISEKFDEGGSVCDPNVSELKNLKSSNFCSSLSYDEIIYSENLDLTRLYNSDTQFIVKKVIYEGQEINELKGAGIYKLVVSDDIKEKDIQCTVRKSTPYLELNPNGGNGKIGTILSSEIGYNVDGMLLVQSSDEKYATAKIVNSSFENIDEELNYHKRLEIKILSERKSMTYITVTLKPKDTKNYESVSTTYTISEGEKIPVTVPSEGDYCRDVIYDGMEQYLVYLPADGDGFHFVGNYKATSDGEYKIRARLNYGYIWNIVKESNNTNPENTSEEEERDPLVDDPYADKFIKCKIESNSSLGPGKIKVSFNMNGGEWAGSTNTHFGADAAGFITYDGERYYEEFSFDDVDIDLSNPDNPSYINIKKDGYHPKDNQEWLLRKGEEERGISDTRINASDLCDSYHGCDITLYVNWASNDYKIHFDGNGATSGSMPDKYCAIDEDCVIPANRFQKTDNGFKEWDTVKNGGGEKYTYNPDIVVKNLTSKGGVVTWYAQWGNLTYTLKFNCNGGTGSMSDKLCVTGVNCTLPNNTCKKAGANFAGWTYGSNTYGNGAVVKDLVGPGQVATLNAKWSAALYYIDLNGRLDGKDAGNISGYGTADVYINGKKVGDNVKDWYKSYPMGTTYEIKNIKATSGHTYEGVSSGSIKGTVGTSNIGFRLSFTTNECTIKYNANGGTFKKNATNIKQTLKYGDKIDNMRNTTGSGGYYNATWSGYTVTSSIAWISSIGKAKFSQDKGYSAVKFCPDLAKKDQTVTLYVNWWRYQYRSCGTGYQCAAAGCASSSTSCQKCNGYRYIGFADSGGQCMPKGWAKCGGNSGTHCTSCQYSCNCTTTCTSYARSAAACGCASWNGWGTTACTVRANVCERRQNFVKAQ